MLTQVFKSILLMSAVGGLLSVFWLCLAPITRKVCSPRWQYYIWLTVLLVMILPVHFKVPSRAPSIPTVTQLHTENRAEEALQAVPKASYFQPQAQVHQSSAIPQITLPQNWFSVLANIWFLGMLVLFATKIIKYSLFLIAIRKNSEVATDIPVPKRLKVRTTNMPVAPLLIGLFKPTLFLPAAPLSEKDLHYILMHELTHYKRGDLLYKWFMMAVQCMHWFNPLVYIVARQIDADCEISCDFAVTNTLSTHEKSDYMRMILDLLEHSKSNLRPLTTQMASSKTMIKRRFTMIQNKKRTSKFVSAISALVAIIMLTTTVFASGVLSDITTADCVIEVYNGENKLALKHDPFLYDGEYYLPLRDVLNGFGITDIAYSNGVITIKIPSKNAKYEENVYTVTIGNALIHYGEPSPNGSGVVMRCPPLLHNNTAFVTLDYFEDFMKSANLQGFRLNVIRPTDPKHYYTKGEKVFIGTAKEQDNYSGELVKRIIVDENGETIAVIPIENQIKENVAQKFNQAEKAAICNGFYQALYQQVFCCYDAQYDTVYESSLWFIEQNNTYIAYFGMADIIKIPQTKFNQNLRLTVTNTYENQTHIHSQISNVQNVNTLPEYTVEQFFKNVELSQYEEANKYCTDASQIKAYQTDNSFAPQKIIGNIKVDYTKNSFNEISAEVYTQSVSHESLYPFVHWKIRLMQQENGSYLISGWESLTDISVDENNNLIKAF